MVAVKTSKGAKRMTGLPVRFLFLFKGEVVGGLRGVGRGFRASSVWA